MMKQAERRDGTQLWVGLLTVTSAVTTLALACATPFSSLAAIAATRMSVRAGVTLMVLTWAVSQAIGFGVLHYPHDPRTVAWGFAMLTAALLSLGAARWGDRIVERSGPVMRAATAFGTGFLGYKVGLLLWSLVLGGVHTALSPYWTAWQVGREALIVVGLVVLYEALVAVGVPAARRLRTA